MSAPLEYRLEQSWLDFSRQVLPGMSPEDEVYETMRRVFYAGSITVFTSVLEATTNVRSPNAAEKFCDLMENYSDELQAFHAREMAGLKKS